MLFQSLVVNHKPSTPDAREFDSFHRVWDRERFVAARIAEQRKLRDEGKDWYVISFKVVE